MENRIESSSPALCQSCQGYSARLARPGRRASIYGYFITRHDDFTRHHLCGKGDPLFVPRGVTLIKSIREKNSGLSSNRLSQEQIGAEFSTRICDLESHINRDEKETVRVKEGISEEIKRADSESDTTGIPLKAKETARPSYRRRKLRVYLP
jgi:hypothetical protein